MTTVRAASLRRVLAALSWTTLTVLSLLPGSERPHTGASGNTEHFVAYALAALVTRLAFQNSKSRYQLLAFSLSAAAFEICQIYIPGRSPGIDNWAASTAGALFGVLLGRLLAHRSPVSGFSLRQP